MAGLLAAGEGGIWLTGLNLHRPSLCVQVAGVGHITVNGYDRYNQYTFCNEHMARADVWIAGRAVTLRRQHVPK